nr:PREDICTED: trehalase-like isoform X2 [Bemisia tabaci]
MFPGAAPDPGLAAKVTGTTAVLLAALALLRLPAAEAQLYNNPNFRCPYKPICASYVYCQGPLLYDYQFSGLFNDSKTFVDKRLLFPEEEIVRKYTALKKSRGGELSRAELESFLAENFADGNELIPFEPPDFTSEPSVLGYIQDGQYRRFAAKLNEVWKTLARVVDRDVLENPRMHSLLYVPNTVIIPGGRFTEVYYWDTYWIVKGLLLCDMFDTAKGVIDNIIYLVKKYGYMLNGSRNYYENRSQPPLLIPMVAAYYQLKQDEAWLLENLPVLELEFQFWMNNRMINVKKDGKTYRMAHYSVETCGPRPESFKEDFTLASNLTSDEERTNLYIELKTAAETGWDFSQRWTKTPPGQTESLLYLKTRSIIPVDLNAFLQLNAHYLSNWFFMAGDISKGEYYLQIAEELLTAIDEVMWREDLKSWFDWDNEDGQSRVDFYASNLTPLWTGSYRKAPQEMGKFAVEYLVSQGIISEDGIPRYLGIPTTLKNFGQQWEAPNMWPPLQMIGIQGLDNTLYPKAQQVAYRLGAKYLETNYVGFVRTGQMFEKYDMNQLGSIGGGGEYVPQTGFGWSNGACFEILSRYGHKLRSPQEYPLPN